MSMPCRSFGREHSNASLSCSRLAAERLDVNSLYRQKEALLRGLYTPMPRAVAAVPPGDRLQLIQAVINHAAEPARRCSSGVALTSPARPQPLEPGPGAASGATLIDQERRTAGRTRRWLARCSASRVDEYDVAKLPYRWLPGLPVVLFPPDYYQSAARFEVMHLGDHWPGAGRLEPSDLVSDL